MRHYSDDKVIQINLRLGTSGQLYAHIYIMVYVVKIHKKLIRCNGFCFNYEIIKTMI